MAYVRANLVHSPPKAKWGVADIPDLSGKVMIVTGGNAGIGRETVKVGPRLSLALGQRSVETLTHPLIQALLAHGAKVYMAARNETKALAAIADLRAETGYGAIFLKLDLADLRSVKDAAREFMS